MLRQLSEALRAWFLLGRIVRPRGRGAFSPEEGDLSVEILTSEPFAAIINVN